MTTETSDAIRNRLAETLGRNARTIAPLQTTAINSPTTRPLLTNGTDDSAYALPKVVQDTTQILGGWPKCVGGALIAPDSFGKLIELESASSLFAYLSGSADINWKSRSNYPNKEEFLERLRQQCEQYASVEYYPHHRSVSETLYYHARVPAAQPGRLEELLRLFSPASPTDATLLRAFVCTLFWGGSPGARPIFVFANGATNSSTTPEAWDTGRGIAKSSTVALLSQLCGGFIEFGSDTDISKLETRLLSAGARDKRVVRIDNVKSERFSCAGLERLVTTPVISGHRMYAGEGSRPNYLTFAVTMNGVAVSEDLASRSVVIELARPAEYRATWRREVHEFIEQYRWSIIAEIIDVLNQPVAANLRGLQRHAEWEVEVLGRQPDAQAILNLLRQRRGEIDADLETVRSIMDIVRAKWERSGLESIQIQPDEMMMFVQEVTSERYAANKLKTFLERLKIPGLSHTRTNSGVRYVWRNPSPRVIQPNSH